MKRVDLMIRKSRSERDLVSIGKLDGSPVGHPSLQELLTEEGFLVGEKVVIIRLEDLNNLTDMLKRV